MHLVKKLTSLLFLFAPIVANADLPYTSTFTDNGNMVREVREYGSHNEIWEWLDLEITKGVTWTSIRNDLKDNGALDNSSQLDGEEHKVHRVTELQPHEKSGWRTASADEVDNMIHAYFNVKEGTCMKYGENHWDIYFDDAVRFIGKFRPTAVYKERTEQADVLIKEVRVSGWAVDYVEAENGRIFVKPCALTVSTHTDKSERETPVTHYGKDERLMNAKTVPWQRSDALGTWLIRSARY